MKGLEELYWFLAGVLSTLFVVFGLEPFFKWVKVQYDKLRGREVIEKNNVG